MIKEDYVSFEIAKLLKEKGYWNIATMLYKENGDIVNYKFPLNNKGFSSTLGVFYEAPTLQMAMKWLRENHNISVRPRYDEVEDEKERLYYAWFFDILSMNPYKTLVEPEQGYSTYEQACEDAIKYCLENLI